MAKRQEIDWVVMGGKPGESAHCKRCGAGLSLGLPIELDVFLAASKAFVKAHSRCVPGRYVEPQPRDEWEWIESRDVGVSSVTIWSVMTCKPSPLRGEYDAPHDSADFGRCYRLLKIVPQWRNRLNEVAAACPSFAPLVPEWGRLTEMYERALTTNDGTELSAEIKRLRGAA